MRIRAVVLSSMWLHTRWGLAKGYFDSVKLKAQADIIQKKLEHEALDDAFSKVWRQYHDSFDDDAAAVVAAMIPAFKSSVSVISPINLSGTISLFKELDRADEAKELIDYYMANRQEQKDFFDLNNHGFGGDAIDPDVQAVFAAKLASFPDNRDPKQILINIILNSGWNDDDLRVAYKLSKDDFIKMFRDTRGTDLRRLVQGALRFRNVQGISPDAQAMSFRAEEALREIALSSKINERRISQKYGIALAAVQAPSPPTTVTWAGHIPST